MGKARRSSIPATDPRGNTGKSGRRCRPGLRDNSSNTRCRRYRPPPRRPAPRTPAFAGDRADIGRRIRRLPRAHQTLRLFCCAATCLIGPNSYCLLLFSNQLWLRDDLDASWRAWLCIAKFMEGHGTDFLHPRSLRLRTSRARSPQYGHRISSIH